MNKSATMNHVLQQSGDSSTQILPTSISYDRLVEHQRSAFLAERLGAPPDVILPVSKNRRLRFDYGSASQHSGVTHLPNVQVTNEEDEIVYTSLTCTQNYAYNRRRDLPDLDYSVAGSHKRINKT